MSNIYLTGYRGVGKSTVAPIVAEKLGWQWADLDVELETRAGRTIREIFAQSGEPTFRDLEATLLEEFAGRCDSVVATGGGIILRPGNRERLKHGFVVWLKADPEMIEARLAADPTTRERRPNLTAAGGIDEIRRVIAERTSLYEEVADLQLGADQDPDRLAELIVEAFGRRPSLGRSGSR